MAPVSRRSFLAGLIAAPIIAAVAPERIPTRPDIGLIAAQVWEAQLALKSREGYGNWLYGGSAGGGKSMRFAAHSAPRHA